MTRSLCKKRRIGRGAMVPNMLVILSHRDDRMRLDDYQWNVADFAVMRIFNFGK